MTKPITDFHRRQRDYTYQREREHIANNIKDDQEYSRRLNRLYDRAYYEIGREMDGYIGRYATREGITVAEAKKRISSHDVKAFEAKAAEYVKNRDFSDKANRELALYNLTMKVNRQELLQRYIELELIALADAEERMLQEKLYEEAIKEYNRQAGLLGRSVLSPEEINREAKRLVNADYHSAHFSDRIWANQKELQRKLDTGLERAILRGQNPRVWARELKDLVRGELALKQGKLNARYAAERIAITEMGRVQVAAQLDSFVRNGYTQCMVVCEPTACKHCKPFDGQVIDLADAVQGLNIPMFHPFCRCSIAAHQGRDELDDLLRQLEGEAKGGIIKE